MHQGDAGESLYFLVRGRLQAWAADGDGNARSRFLNEIVPGDSVGEMSLLTGAPRTVGIQAIRDSLLVRIDREDFERLSREYPALALRLAANVASLAAEQRAGPAVGPQPQNHQPAAAGLDAANRGLLPALRRAPGRGRADPQPGGGPSGRTRSADLLAGRG